ncbi:MAG: DUF2125 domain-containing protein [Deltaproteobacteria bacterium]
MNRFKAATAVSLIFLTCPAFAESQVELTIEQYIAMGNAEGGKIEYSSKDSGADYVEYKDVKIANPEGDFLLDTAWMRATEGTDGLTTLTFADAVNVSVKANGAAEPTSFVISSENLSVATNMLVPNPETLTSFTYNMAADTFNIGDLAGDTSVLHALDMTFDDMDLAFNFDMATMKSVGGLKAASIDALYDFAMEGQQQKADSKMSDLDISFDLDVPQGEQDMPAYLNGTKNAVVKMTAGASSGSGSIVDPNFAVDYTGTGEGSEIELSIVDGDLLYHVSGGAIAYNIAPVGMPIEPVDISMSEMLMNVAVPFGSTDAPGEANVAIKLADLVIGESAWAMIDPDKTLPRDPMNVDMDISANVQFAEDFIMESQMNPMGAAKPMDATINSFLISFAGANATATGAVTFDPTMPMPLPTGAINVALKGATGLAQKLAALGLVPMEQVGMFNGMLGMFAKPVGEDSYSSDIEFKGMEGITVNGMPIPM